MKNCILQEPILPEEKELYEAWKAYVKMCDKASADLTEEEAAPIHSRCYAAYEKAYDVLGARQTQSIIRKAKESV
jgi:hypothetical protein